MPSPQIARQIDFSKGVYVNVNRYEQPPGTVRGISNFVYDRDGALQTCDGSLIISSLNGAGPVTNQYPFRFLLRYAQTGAPMRIYTLQPTGTNVNVINVSTTSWTAPDITLASTYDIPNAVQIGDNIAVALGRGTTPAILHNNPLVSAGSWANVWNATANIPTWLPNVTIVDGQPIQPNPPNGHIYVCQQINQDVLNGLSGATQPTWPTAQGATVTDGTVVWQESGPVSAPMPPGADFFFYHMGFLWAWGTDTLYTNNLDGPDALRMSDLNNFFSWNPLNSSFIGRGDGTLPMGGAVMTLGEAGIAATAQIVLFKDTTSYSVLGALGPNAKITQVPTGVGCVAPGTIVFIDEVGVVRLSERGVTVFDGQNDSFEQITSPIRGYLFGGFNELTLVDWAHIRYSKACRVHNPPAYLLACPLASMRVMANVAVGSVTTVGTFATSGSFTLPPGLPTGTSIYMTTNWNTSIWQTNVSNVATINWAADTPAPSSGGAIYWMAAYGASQGGNLTRLFIYHLALQAWAVIDLPFAISTLAYIAQNPYPAYTICGGSYDGCVRRLFSGDRDWDGTAIVGSITLPEIGNPITPSYIKQVSINGRAKYSNICGLTGTSLQYVDRDAQIRTENLFVAPNQIPVYVNIDKTVISCGLQLQTSGPMIIEGLEIAAQPKKYAGLDINRDGGYTTPNPAGAHGPTVPQPTYQQGSTGVGAGTVSLTIPLSIAPISQSYMASVAPNWNTTYWIANISSEDLTIGFGTPAPAGGGLVHWNVIVNAGQSPIVLWPVSAGSIYTNITFTNPVTVPYTPVVTPNWNTKFWLTNVSATGFSIAFDTPASASGGILYYNVATAI